MEGGDFNAREWPFFWITQTAGQYVRKVEPALRDIGLDIPRWRVLMCVVPGQAIGVTEIAELAIAKLPTMLKIIQRMEADGLVACAPRASDGRVTDVSLTERGLEARTRAWAVAKAIYERAFEEVSGSEEARLNKLLERIYSSLRS
ncbi:MAG: MarR family winged helix-turn-helix transcriptional regulator [Pseudomonadota bacterium]